MNGTQGLINVDDIESASANTAGCTIPYCPIEMSSITEERCKEITSDPRYNEKCIKHKECISRWKVCPSCLRFGEVKKMGHIDPVCCARGKDLCGFHLLYGAGAHRSISEMKEEIRKYEDKLATRQSMGSAPQKHSQELPVGKKNIQMPQNGPDPSSEKSGRMDLIKQSAEKALKAENKSGENPVASMPFPIEVREKPRVVKSGEVANPIERKGEYDFDGKTKVAISEGKASEDVPKAGDILRLHTVNEAGAAVQKDVEVISEVFNAPWDEISPYKKQPRRYFSKSKMSELAYSIRERGQIIPVLLRRLENEGQYKWELIDGERRYRACKIAGKKTVKAVLVEVKDEQEQFETSVVANFCREGYAPMEVADTIKRFKEEFHYTDAQIGKFFGENEEGKSGAWVSMHYSLLKLHPQVQAMLNPELSKRQRLPKSIAFEIAMQEKDHDRQLVMATEIRNRKMSTSHAKSFIRKKIEELTGTYKTREGTRKRRPSDHYKLLVDLVGRTQNGFAHHLNMGERVFHEMFAHRSYDDREALSDALKQIIEFATKLRETIENID